MLVWLHVLVVVVDGVGILVVAGDGGGDNRCRGCGGVVVLCILDGAGINSIHDASVVGVVGCSRFGIPWCCCMPW